MNNLRAVLDRFNVQAYLTANPSNIRYQTGYLADYCYTLTLSDRQFYFTDGRFTIEANRDLSDDWTVVEITPQLARSAISEILTAYGVSHIAIDSDVMYSEYRFLSDVTAGIESVDVTDTVADIRAVKTAREIELITKAQRIAENALLQLKAFITEGITERVLAAKLDYLMRTGGADGTSFDTIVAFGENSAIAHAKPGDRQLKRGDIILIDFGAKVNGYCSDMTRCFVYGYVSREVEDMYSAVYEANMRAVQGIKAGLTCREADSIARACIDSRGYEGLFTHSLGHGVGVDIHESPYLSPRSGDDRLLTAGMVVTVEPGIYIKGLGGIRIEDMIVVTEDGNVNLTLSDKKLEIINN